MSSRRPRHAAVCGSAATLMVPAGRPPRAAPPPRAAASRARPLEPDWAEADVDRRLGGDRTDTRLQPWDDRPDAQVVRLDRDAEPAGARVSGDDAVGHAGRVAPSAPASKRASDA